MAIYKATFFTEKHDIHFLFKAKSYAYTDSKMALVEKFLNENCFKVGRKTNNRHVQDLYTVQKANDNLAYFYKNNLIKISKKSIDTNFLIINIADNQTVLF